MKRYKNTSGKTIKAGQMVVLNKGGVKALTTKKVKAKKGGRYIIEKVTLRGQRINVLDSKTNPETMNSFEKWWKKVGKGYNDQEEKYAAKNGYLAGLKKASRLAALKKYPVKAILEEIENIDKLSFLLPNNEQKTMNT